MLTCTGKDHSAGQLYPGPCSASLVEEAEAVSDEPALLVFGKFRESFRGDFGESEVGRVDARLDGLFPEEGQGREGTRLRGGGRFLQEEVERFLHFRARFPEAKEGVPLLVGQFHIVAGSGPSECPRRGFHC